MSGSIEQDWSDEAKERQRQIGVEWLEDSSLERWFPFTAEELTALRARVKELEERLADQVSLTDAFRVSEANFDEACDKLEARIRELEEAMPNAPELRLIAKFTKVTWPSGAEALSDMASRIEAVMRKGEG